jgi:hypothetical protein
VAIQYFDNLDLNGNRARDAADGVLPQDYVTVAQLSASTDIGFAATIGDGVATTFNVVHGLNSTDVVVQVQEISSGDAVGVGTSTNGVNSVDITFSVAPASNSFRVLVLRVP